MPASRYTQGARTQLESLGFHVLYCEYVSVIEAFKTVGIDVSFDETTDDASFGLKQAAWDSLTTQQRGEAWSELIRLNKSDVDSFMGSLEQAVNRLIDMIRVIPLHGNSTDLRTVKEAIEFVSGYNEGNHSGPLVRYEVQIRYSNGDAVNAQFQAKASVIEFLNQYQSGNWTPNNGPDDDDIYKRLNDAVD